MRRYAVLLVAVLVGAIGSALVAVATAPAPCPRRVGAGGVVNPLQLCDPTGVYCASLVEAGTGMGLVVVP